MNYKEIYDKIVTRAKERNLAPGSYFEIHHIIPKSLGGNNKPENLVKLTAREHFIAHILLWKIYKNAPMAQTVFLMCNLQGVRLNSRMYESCKKLSSASKSSKLKGKPSGRKGQPSPRKGMSLNLTEEQLKERGARRKGKGMGNAGWPGERSEEYKKKISAAGKGHRPYHVKRVSINGAEYESATEAAKQLKITYNVLIRRIRSDKHSEYFYIT